MDKIYKLSILFSKPTLLQTQFTQKISNSINNMFISFIDFDNHIQIINIKDVNNRAKTYTGGTGININTIMSSILPTLKNVANSITYFDHEIVSSLSQYNEIFNSTDPIEKICYPDQKYSIEDLPYSKKYMKFRTGGLYDIVEGTSCFEWIKTVYSKIKGKIQKFLLLFEVFLLKFSLKSRVDCIY